jgi:predicted RNase H-like HicB family nuclease
VTIAGHPRDDLHPKTEASIMRQAGLGAMIELDRYLILIEGGPPSNYSAWSPDVPGCVAAGVTIDACVEEMRTALREHLELMREHDEVIPEPSGPGVYVERAIAA